MRPTIPLIVLAILAPLTHALAADASGSAAAAKPNILFCIADDASYPYMSAYGCKWVHTPAFDRVAKNGLLFTRAYTPNAKCAPSRACIITGRNSWQLEAAANHICYFPAKFKSYAEALAQHGYTIGSTAKGWSPGIADDENGKKREMVGPPINTHRAKPTTTGINPIDYAANFQQFVETAPASKPWCFWYGSTEPHRAYEAGSGARAGKKISDIDEVPGVWPDNELVRSDLLDYALEIEHFDTHLGRMIKLLEERGQLDNTLIVVTADNGMPFPRVKGQEYDQSNHLPLAIMWPKGIATPGRTIDDYVCFIDFAPTFLEVAGVTQQQSGMQPITGRSLTEYFRTDKSGHVIPARDHVLIGKERHDVGRPHDQGYPIRGIVRQNVLYIRNYEPGRWPAGNPETGYTNTDASPTKSFILSERDSPFGRHYWDMAFGVRPEEELYDLRADPYCLNNLANDPAWSQRKMALSGAMVAQLKEQQDPRMFGRGDIFEKYPYADEKLRNFFDRTQAGEKLKAGWVSPTDVQQPPQ